MQPVAARHSTDGLFLTITSTPLPVLVIESESIMLLVCGEVLKQLMFVQLRAAEAEFHFSWAAYVFA
jgi:hypothetical protein